MLLAALAKRVLGGKPPSTKESDAVKRLGDGMVVHGEYIGATHTSKVQRQQNQIARRAFASREQESGRAGQCI